MNHQFKKKYGQNFLRDPNLLQKIVALANVKDLKVIEIGPGEGALTKYLVKDAKEVIAYEIDESLKPILSSLTVTNEHLKIIYEDYMQVNQEQISCDILIGNIPYYITTPIIFKFLENDQCFKAVLMMQKEVGERLTATPNSKKYNALSVIVQYVTNVKIVLNINKRLFYPIPKVDSVVVSFEKKVLVDTLILQQHIIAFVKAAFKQKRKTFLNNVSEYYEIEKHIIKSFLSDNNLKEDIRAEAIPAEMFIELGRKWYKQFLE